MTPLWTSLRLRQRSAARRRPLLRAPRLVAVAIIAASCARNDGVPRASGTVEYTETDVSPMVAARVLRVLVEEGTRVRRGDTLVTLTQATLGPQIDQRRAGLAAAEAELRDLQNGARPAEIARATAEVSAAQAEATKARRDADRYRELRVSGSVSVAQAESYEAAARVAEERLTTASQSLRLLQQGARSAQLSGAQSAVETARAQLRSAEATATDLILVAPADGTVLRRYVEPGEVVAAGTPTLSLGDTRDAWVRVYVAAPVLPRLRLGQAADVRLEGLPDHAFEGRITSIATTAEFTPRVALTERERADLLFGVKVQLHDTTGALKGGLPATVSFPAAGGVPDGR
jgi:membrane fusion protein YbhG